MSRPTRRCFGCCAIRSGSPARNTAAASPNAAAVRFTSTGCHPLVPGAGRPVAHGPMITTVEALAPDGKLHPVQQAWIDHDVPQCGYCQTGMMMAAAALLGKIRSRPMPISTRR